MHEPISPYYIVMKLESFASSQDPTSSDKKI